MINLVTDSVRQTGLTRWKILLMRRETHSRSWEASLPVKEENRQEWLCRVRLFRDFHKDGKKYTGEASLEFNPAAQETVWKKKLEKLAEDTLSDPWPWYPMHTGSLGNGATIDSSLQKKPSLDAWLEPLAQSFLEGVSGVKASMVAQTRLETSIELLETVYRDSLDREMTHTGARTLIKADLGCRETSLAQGEYQPDRLTTLGRFMAEEAGLCPAGSPWEGPLPERIYLGGELPGILFSYLLRQLDGAALYAGASSLSAGGPLLEGVTGDRINMRSLVRLYNSPYSRWFDEEGVAMKEAELVRDGMVKSFTASQREAHLLGLPLTGHFVNFSVGPGTLSADELRESPYLEILHAEKIKINDASGDFSMEIPFAFGSEGPGKPRRAVTGLKLKGNLRSLLSASRFSKTIAQREYYEGPELVRIPSSYLVKGGK